MNHSQDEMKKAVKAGYWNLFSFNPALKAEGKNPFTLTSKEGDGSYQDFLNNEARYTRLVKPFPERAERLFAKSEEVAMRDISIYSSLLIYTSNCKLNT